MTARTFRQGLAPATAALVAALAACSWNPEPVPVRAASSRIEQLAGRWAGEYSSEVSGRSGSILFELEAGRDTAHGDVLMVPCMTRLPGVEPAQQPEPRLLRIAFVEIEGGLVRGTLEVYRDPDCGCPLETTFTGRVTGDVAEGTYTSRHLDCHISQSGRWRVERVRGDP